MKKTFTFTAKKADQAIANGLKELGKEMHEVEINIISNGGFLKKAEVEIIIDMPEEQKAAPAPAPKVETAAPVGAALSRPLSAKEKPAKKEKEKSKEKPAVATKSEEKPTKKLFEKFAEPASSAATPAFATKYADKSGESSADNKKKKDNKKPSSSSAKATASPKKAEPKAANATDSEETPKPKKRAETAPSTAEHAAKATEFLQGLLKLTEFTPELECETGDNLKVTLKAESAILIGKHGDMLDALQYLTSQVVNKDEEKYIPVVVDVLGYRAKRATTLQNIAQKMADKCINLNRRIALEPMTSSDRRIVHTYLDSLGGIVTRSQGFEPNRRIVIYPEK